MAMTAVLSHAGLTDYCARHPEMRAQERSGESVAWVFDDQYRVSCRLAQGGRLVLEARVAEMPQDVAEGDSLLLDAMQCAAWRAAEHPDSLALSEGEDMLLLQQWVSADASADMFEQSLERFVNATANWRQALLLR